MRKDLTPSQIAVQSCHAAIEATRNGLIPPEIEHPNLVLIGSENLPALLQIRAKLRTLGIRFQEFVEPDIGNQITAIATAPLSGDIRKHFKKYQLLNLESPRQRLTDNNLFSRRSTMNVSNEVFKSRFGFHPCDYTTYLKLKNIKKWYYEWLRAAASWERWHRKEPQNRVIRRKIPGKPGVSCGYEIVGPQPEPVVCPFFGKGTWFLADFENARMPRTEEQAGQLFFRLSHSLEEINQLYFKIKSFKGLVSEKVA